MLVRNNSFSDVIITLKMNMKNLPFVFFTQYYINYIQTLKFAGQFLFLGKTSLTADYTGIVLLKTDLMDWRKNI